MSAKIVSSGALALMLIGGFSLAQSGCGETKEGDSKPEPCDVPAIFEASCSDRICHSADEPAAFLDLVSAGLDDRLVGVAGSEDCGGQILVEPGQRVEAGAVIAIIEAMKAECDVSTPVAGIVSAVYAQPSQSIAAGAPVIAGTPDREAEA